MRASDLKNDFFIIDIHTKFDDSMNYQISTINHFIVIFDTKTGKQVKLINIHDDYRCNGSIIKCLTIDTKNKLIFAGDGIFNNIFIFDYKNTPRIYYFF